ncbi:MAG: hypothetical protein HKN76_13035 [Saprospiraceae bacterium]|nr:hypothetical protein [Saprospiraceae bacterium]
MKNIIWLTAICVLFSFESLHGQNQDETGLPGDHFSLEGALELFKSSDSPEDFEKKLNTEKNYVNNLDLNDDGEIDYVRVVDRGDEQTHALVLQAVVSKSDAQDVAVIEIEKTSDAEAILQIIGDEDIYGEEIIIEPFEEESVESKGPAAQNFSSLRIQVNVWLWPSVRFMYRPGYVSWVSPWRWRHYPRWWKPWRPHPFHRYISLRPHYHIHYHPVALHRVGNAHRHYVGHRTASVSVKKRYSSNVATYRAKKGIVQTKKTTVVSGPRGGKAVVQKQSTTVAGKGPAGKAAVKKSKTDVRGKKANGDTFKASRKKSEVRAKGSGGQRVKASKSTRRVKSNNAKSSTSKKKVTKKSPRKN